MKQSIGEFLATLRKAHGFTQQEVADRLGVSNRTVSAWECGTVYPDILLLPVLAELYGVTTDEILAGERNVQEEAQAKKISEKSGKNLLKNKLSEFGTRSLILFGVYAAGLLFFFIGLYLDFSKTIWTGWQWWLLLLFSGLVTVIVCAVCMLALWKKCENSVDDEFAECGSFYILLRKKLALFCYLAAGMSLVFGAVCLFPLFAENDAVRGQLFAVAAIVFFLFALGKYLFGFFLVDAAQRRWGGDEAIRIRARNAKRYRKCALFCLIPVLIGVGGITLFAFWKPEKRFPVYEAELEEFTRKMETLVVESVFETPNPQDGPEAGEYHFPLSELSETAAEGERYDLGNGFSCVFEDNMETCRIEYAHEIDTDFFNREGKSFTVSRLHAAEGEYSVYNVRYFGYDGKIGAADWKGDRQRLLLRLEAEENRAKLLNYYKADYFRPATILCILEIFFGVGICLVVCAVKREKPKVELSL